MAEAVGGNAWEHKIEDRRRRQRRKKQRWEEYLPKKKVREEGEI